MALARRSRPNGERTSASRRSKGERGIWRLSDPGLELLRLAFQGPPRQVGRILRAAMQRAVPKGLTHFPDDLLQETIVELR